MKQFKLLMAAGSLFALQAKAQFYGQLHYPHDSTQLSSAQVTNLSPGYVMAGFRAHSSLSSTSADFVIDKVDQNGNFTGGAFSNAYIINDNVSCSTPQRVHNCSGITIVETNNLGSGERYAIAGAYNQGVFFATLGAAGNIIKTYRWNFPSTAAIYNKPCIRESAVTPGRYYICGDYNQQSYVMKVDGTTPVPTPLFSNFYNGTRLEANALIESPYNPNEVVVVGLGNGPTVRTGTNAFFMKLNSATGAVNTFSLYNRMFDGDDWFSCIEIANNPNGGRGYILGGRSYFPLTPSCSPQPCNRPNNANYVQWMCKLDPIGGVIWSTLIQPANTTTANFSPIEVSDVYERLDPNNGAYEYYGVAGVSYVPSFTVSGGLAPLDNLVVYKLDKNGNNSILPNEFHYTDGIAASMATSLFSNAQLTGINANAPNDGIQAYGSEALGKEHYFVKAYFNGESGCSDTTVSWTWHQGPDSVFTNNVARTSFAANCPANFSLARIALPTVPNVTCTAGSLPNGSNAKITGIQTLSENAEGISIYPNPASSRITITRNALSGGPARVEIYSLVGQRVSSSLMHDSQTEIDLESLNINSGVYLVKITSGNITTCTRLIYQKD